MKKESHITRQHPQIQIRTKPVPILLVEGNSPHLAAIQAVNFIRSGNHEVQLVIENGHESALRTYKQLSDLILELQQEEEKFWLFGKPKLENGGHTVVRFQYHPSMFPGWNEPLRKSARKK